MHVLMNLWSFRKASLCTEPPEAIVLRVEFSASLWKVFPYKGDVCVWGGGGEGGDGGGHMNLSHLSTSNVTRCYAGFTEAFLRCNAQCDIREIRKFPKRTDRAAHSAVTTGPSLKLSLPLLGSIFAMRHAM